MKALKIKVFGRVQGVIFRHSSKKKAEELGIRGFVRNEPDGTLYLEVEGEAKPLGEFIEWCRKGPVLAEVTRAEIKETEPKGFRNFEIL
ncbi:MAG TPA: acylphosphatase [Candidatus Paceibacterota bacterium]